MNNLYARYLNNELTPAELEDFLVHLQTPEGRAGLEHFMDATWYEMYPEKENTASRSKIVPFIKRPWVRYAAAIILLSAGAALWLNKPPSVAPNGTEMAKGKDVAPGGEKAMLTLADGTKILLDSAANGVLASQSGVSVIKLADGRLAYQSANGEVAHKIAKNTLTTPRGGKFRITLPDGTKVWLNAATTLSYPVTFEPLEREVELSGEAYFEVAAGAKAPFKVVSAGQEVNVLGTSFNVNAYGDEEFTKTTLLSGSVSIAIATDKAAKPDSKILQAGQQSRVHDGQLKVTVNADTEQAVAWKNGQLDMRNLDIKALMRQISRWYDVEIVYEGVVPERRFGGIIDQDVYLSNILQVLDAGGIRCRLENRKLYVSAK